MKNQKINTQQKGAKPKSKLDHGLIRIEENLKIKANNQAKSPQTTNSKKKFLPSIGSSNSLKGFNQDIIKNLNSLKHEQIPAKQKLKKMGKKEFQNRTLIIKSPKNKILYKECAIQIQSNIQFDRDERENCQASMISINLDEERNEKQNQESGRAIELNENKQTIFIEQINNLKAQLSKFQKKYDQMKILNEENKKSLREKINNYNRQGDEIQAYVNQIKQLKLQILKLQALNTDLIQKNLMVVDEQKTINEETFTKSQQTEANIGVTRQEKLNFQIHASDSFTYVPKQFKQKLGNGISTDFCLDCDSETIQNIKLKFQHQIHSIKADYSERFNQLIIRLEQKELQNLSLQKEIVALNQKISGKYIAQQIQFNWSQKQIEQFKDRNELILKIYDLNQEINRLKENEMRLQLKCQFLNFNVQNEKNQDLSKKNNLQYQIKLIQSYYKTFLNQKQAELKTLKQKVNELQNDNKLKDELLKKMVTSRKISYHK